MKKKKFLAVIVIILICITIGGYQLYTGNKSDQNKFYGNVEYDYINLSYIDTERIAEVFVTEGSNVTKGQKLSVLHSERLMIDISAAEAEKQAASYALLKLKNGYLPEDIEKALQNVRLTKARLDLAQLTYDRKLSIYNKTSGDGIAKHELDAALTDLKVSKESYEMAQKDYEILKKGSRREDIELAAAKLDIAQAKLDSLNRRFQDTVLISPLDGFVSKQFLRKGEIAGVQKPVFEISVIDHVKVRAYISEPMLGVIKLGDDVTVYSDSFTHSYYSGKVSYISPSAEFTPKTVQTEELRTSLVYMIKINVDEPEGLKQGMPVTVLYNVRGL